ARARFENRFQNIEARTTSGGLVLSADPGHDALEQRQRPFAFEESLGGLFVAWFELVLPLGITGIDRQRRDPATSLGGPVVRVAVGEKAGAVGPQERPEPALARVGGRDVAALQQPGEVALRQVQGLFGAMPLAPDEGVERIPVGGAELR